MFQARIAAVLDQVARPGRSARYPVQSDGKTPVYISDLFAENVFTLKQMQKSLPKPVFADFVKQMRGRKNLDKATADAIAHAVKVWAMDRGATHFTHWFQPQTDTTAEKHDCFLTLKSVPGPAGEEVRSLLSLICDLFLCAFFALSLNFVGFSVSLVGAFAFLRLLNGLV
jgi:glutamine synthetase